MNGPMIGRGFGSGMKTRRGGNSYHRHYYETNHHGGGGYGGSYGGGAYGGGAGGMEQQSQKAPRHNRLQTISPTNEKYKCDKRPMTPLSPSKFSNLRISSYDQCSPPTSSAGPQNHHRVKESKITRSQKRRARNERRTNKLNDTDIKREPMNKTGSYTKDELIKLWYNKNSHVCPDIEEISIHEIRDRGDSQHIKVIFPINRTEEEEVKPSQNDEGTTAVKQKLFPEIEAAKLRHFKKVHGRPRDHYIHKGVEYKV